MIPIKTDEELKIMLQGGQKLTEVFQKVLKKIKPGVKLKNLEKRATDLIEKKGGFPSFKMVKGYRWATCINVNQGVVHGIPGSYRLKANDLVSLDMGMYYQGFHTDMACTIFTSEESIRPPRRNEASEFLKAGQQALKKAIEAVKPGNRVGHISAAIEKEIKKAGFNPVKDLTGHGVGKDLHEEPQIPCFLKEKINQTPLLKKGMALAIEVIYSQGQPDLILAKDGWTIQTADNQLAGLFEETVMITSRKTVVLTKSGVFL